LKYLLDTNVLSQPTKANPDPAVVEWWVQCDDSDFRISAISIHEVRMGLQDTPHGRRRERLEGWLLSDVLGKFHGRILPVDAAVADASGRLLYAAKMSGHTAELGDVLIAATAKVHGLKVETLNWKHFEPLGVEIVEF
jgi:toxin FitB